MSIDGQAVPGSDVAMRCVLFDLDGTLADTAPDMGGALNTLLEENGDAVLPMERIRPLVSAGSAGLIRLAYGMDDTHPRFDPLRRRFLEIYQRRLCDMTTLFPGIAELLDQLDECDVRYGVVTNKPGFLTDPLLDALGLSPRIACAVSGDTLARRKPDPDPILHACTVAGVAAAQSLMVGDDARDIQSARAAGARSLAVNWGYIAPGEDPTQWNADGVIDTPADIRDWL